MSLDAKRLSGERRAAWLSVIANLFLTVGKIAVGLRAASEALFADGLHNAADLFASAVVLGVIGYANKPADDDHPYGHGKAEVVTSGVVGLLLFIVAGFIVVEAGQTLLEGVGHPPDPAAAWVAAASFALKWALFRYSLHVARRLRSKAIEAIAYDHQTDIAASLAALFGVLFAVAGGQFGVPGLAYADPIGGLIVAAFIVRIAWRMMVEAVHILMERSVDPQAIDIYRSIIARFPDVKRIDRIRAREHGHYILLDVRLSVPSHFTVQEGHDLGRKIKAALMAADDRIREVLIHLNPYSPDG
ncbi:cation diffusion facilitator family transporter [Hydrogenibacillus sp. N12]|uniref:cation diffusion facilitator family transporter n=1 Tax=Hydrogenibacillus sp. N12 TaxID=2866627 RepID=UPI001C7DD54F|nr:cation diffusion facilitator family transporter [Hydrogenibacillus sp. N12]QZA32430.1 cation diffusion facilitator family transporter [Hydrogenibacillus sp. N12]